MPNGLEWALWAVSTGQPVFPVRPDNHAPYGNADVASALGIPVPSDGTGGCKLATTNPDAVRAMWARFPDARIGCAMGGGRMTIDVDEKNGKSGSATMAARGWSIPTTASQRTQSGGMHYLVSVPDGASAPTDAGVLGEGIDRRGDGGYVVLYDAAFLSGPPAPAPEWAVAAGSGGSGRDRKPLGTDRAPSFDHWLQALDSIDPNDLGRDEWIKLSAAVRQSGTGLADDTTLQFCWDTWCARYERNCPSDNARQWRSLDEGTVVGWTYLLRSASPSGQATVAFGANGEGLPTAPPMPGQMPSTARNFGEILDASEQAAYFQGCTWVTDLGRIIAKNGTAYTREKFNAALGGKRFIIDQTGRVTDDAWKAATCSTLWTIPKVEGTRFLPHLAPGTIIMDELGRT
ncbi:bifunctional DNA primase/polymerase, partial [Novosphingobium sp. HII-3]|uniref:bifunctional DNA primase/polymerase n=1 Tax=Novosphingobium sp. HII-3 TaxID=2075565 RepID=UPI0018EB0874